MNSFPQNSTIALLGYFASPRRSGWQRLRCVLTAVRSRAFRAGAFFRKGLASGTWSEGDTDPKPKTPNHLVPIIFINEIKIIIIHIFNLWLFIWYLVNLAESILPYSLKTLPPQYNSIILILLMGNLSLNNNLFIRCMFVYLIIISLVFIIIHWFIFLQTNFWWILFF